MMNHEVLRREDKGPERSDLWSYHFICFVIALWVQGQEALSFMKIKIGHDIVNVVLCSPPNVISIKLCCLWNVMLPCSQKSSDIIFICSKIKLLDD